jgi:hypothetical protein
VKDIRKINVLLNMGGLDSAKAFLKYPMTNLPQSKFDQLVRLVAQAPEPREKLRLAVTREALRRRLALLFERPLPTDKLPASE